MPRQKQQQKQQKQKQSASRFGDECEGQIAAPGGCRESFRSRSNEGSRGSRSRSVSICISSSNEQCRRRVGCVLKRAQAQSKYVACMCEGRHL
jgi:hypothetical protein